MNLDKILKPLEDLFTVTQLDWHCQISQTFTEPVCPVVRIYPDHAEIARYTAYFEGDNLEATLTNLVEKVRSEIIDGVIQGDTNWPITNTDDDIINKWLKDRQSDKDLVFPYEFFYERHAKEQQEAFDERMKDPEEKSAYEEFAKQFDDFLTPDKDNGK